MGTKTQMPSVWFVKQEGRLYGPFTSARLKKLADAGKVFATSEVSRHLEGPWAEASQVRGLFTPKSDSPQGHMSSTCAGATQEGECWYYRELGSADTTPHGPHSSEEMGRLIAQGTVRASTLVVKRGDSQWETAFSSGLFMDAPRPESRETHGSPVEGASSSRSPSIAEEPDSEKVLWVGRPSHHANYGTYALSVLGSPFVLPAIWGLGKYADRDSTRYLITTRRVRIKTGAGSKKRRTDIPLSQVTDARMVCPPSLRRTDLCNVELLGEKSGAPLVTLEGIPLTQSALVISLCESAVHRHIPTQVAERLAADTRAQEMEIQSREDERRRNEEREQRELLERAESAEARVRRAEREASRARTSLQGVAGAAYPGITFKSAWTPPPPPSFVSRRKKVSGLTSWWFGAKRHGKTVRVKGHYRGKTWVKAHDRHLHEE